MFSRSPLIRIGLAMSGALGAIEIAHEGLEAAVVIELLRLDLGAAGVGEFDAHAGVQEGEFAQPVLDRRKIIIDHGEGRGRGQERDLGAAFRPCRRSIGAGPVTSSGVDRIAILEADQMLLAVAPDPEPEPGRKRVDDGDADAVQAAGNLVGVLVEFSAGVQLGHDDLGRRYALLAVDVGRNAASVVGDGDRAVGVERHRDLRGMAGERLVDGVVDDLIDHMMQARAIIGVADIHAGPLAHGVETAQHLDRIGARNRALFQGSRKPEAGGGFGHGTSELSALQKP